MTIQNSSQPTTSDPAARRGLWLVTAIIQEFRLDPVTRALEQVPGFGGMTVSDCRGFGRGKLRDEEDDVAEGAVGARDAVPRRRREDTGFLDFTAKVKIEVAVAGERVADAVVQIIARAAHTGRPGDGKVFAWPIDRAVRVRTFESDDRAL
jgi:nitrogen regulatory protein PII